MYKFRRSVVLVNQLGIFKIFMFCENKQPFIVRVEAKIYLI